MPFRAFIPLVASVPPRATKAGEWDACDRMGEGAGAPLFPTEAKQTYAFL